jgi:uncharacterized protein YecE (DUF72 family)
MARHHIGLPSLRGTLERYAERYDLLEVRLDPGPLPKPSTLRAWRKKVPPSFVFSVVVPRAVGELRPSIELDAGLGQVAAMALELEARCILIPSPPSVTPTDANKKRLSALVDRIPHDAVTLAWEPHGVWETEDAARLAHKLGIVLVVDPAREPAPPGPIAYFRIRGLGESARLSPAAIERVARELRDRREAYVVIESIGPAGVADALRKQAGRRVASLRAPSTVLRPRTTLHAEDEEQ